MSTSPAPAALPLISVVIPTFARPDLVIRAVDSVRAQTFRAFEIVVVIDGPDADTEARLAAVDEPRLRVIPLPERAGRGPATNRGIDAARASWIALLDDDDEWQPEKLHLQWQEAHRCGIAQPLIASRFVARSDAGDQVWPRREPRPGEPICEYLLVQHGLRGGEGMLLPSTLLFPRRLAQSVPFAALPQFIDLDWLLRVTSVPGVAVRFVKTPVPLAVWHIGPDRSRISTRSGSQSALEFARSHRHALTPRAHVAFLLTQVSMIAAREGRWSRFGALIREACRVGRPRVMDLAAHMLIWGVARPSRLRLGAAADRWAGRTPSAVPVGPLRRLPSSAGALTRMRGLAVMFPATYVRGHRQRRLFADVHTRCLFIGYPRSGHTLIGSLLDAHPEAVIAHELDLLRFVYARFSRAQMFAMLLDNAQQAAASGSTWGGYTYAVPGQWQGRFDRIGVIGDKHAEATTSRLHLSPWLLRRIPRALGSPVKYLHVVRNPYDNIATISKKSFTIHPKLVGPRRDTLQDSIEYYFALCQTVAWVRQERPADVLDVRHEDFVCTPAHELARICAFLNLPPHDDYLRDCARVVNTEPRQSRATIDWHDDTIAQVQERLQGVPFLTGYSFDH